jgi:hypothetical protein
MPSSIWTTNAEKGPDASQPQPAQTDAQSKENVRREKCVKELLEVETRYQTDLEKICT